MPRTAICEETKAKVIALYNNGVENKEISVLTDISTTSITNIIHQAVQKGIAQPKQAKLFNQPKTPKGQGKGKYIKKGYNPHNKKLTEQQESELVEDYFVHDMTYGDLMDKYGLWQGSIKIILDKAIKKGLYQPKGRGYRRR